MPACPGRWWKTIYAQIVLGFIWHVSVHSWSLEMTSDGEVLLHGYAVKCEVAPSKTIRNPKVWSPIFVEPWSKKMRSPNSSALSPPTWSVWSRFRRIAKWTSLYHMLAKVINLSRDVHVSCSLLDLCRRHVVVFQVKVRQVTNIQQLVGNFLERFTI